MSLHDTFVSMGFPSQDVAEILGETSHYKTALDMLVSKRNRRIHSTSGTDGLLPNQSQARNISDGQNMPVDSLEHEPETDQIGVLAELSPQDLSEFTGQNDHLSPALRPISPEHQRIAELPSFTQSNQYENTAAMGINMNSLYIPSSQKSLTNPYSQEVDEFTHPSFSSQQVLNSNENFPQPQSSFCQSCMQGRLCTRDSENENRQNFPNFQTSHLMPFDLPTVNTSVLPFNQPPQGYSLDRFETQTTNSHHLGKLPNPFQRHQNPFENSPHFNSQTSGPFLDNSDLDKKQPNSINPPIPNTYSPFSQPPHNPNPEHFDSNHKNQSQNTPNPSMNCIENSFKPFGQPPDLDSSVPDPPSAPLPPMSQLSKINAAHSLNPFNLPPIKKPSNLPPNQKGSNIPPVQTESNQFGLPPDQTAPNPFSLPSHQIAPNPFSLPSHQIAPNPFSFPPPQAGPNPFNLPPPQLESNPFNLPPSQAAPNPFNLPPSQTATNPFNLPPPQTAPNPFNLPPPQIASNTFNPPTLQAASNPFNPTLQTGPNPFNPTLQTGPNPFNPPVQTEPNPFNPPVQTGPNPFNLPPPRTAPNLFDQSSDSAIDFTCQARKIPLTENSAEEPYSQPGHSMPSFNYYEDPPNPSSNPASIYFPNVPQGSNSEGDQSLNPFGMNVSPSNLPQFENSRDQRNISRPFEPFSYNDRPPNLHYRSYQSPYWFNERNEFPSYQHRYSDDMIDEADATRQNPRVIEGVSLHEFNSSSADPSLNSFNNPPVIQNRLPAQPALPPMLSHLERPNRPRFPSQATSQEDSSSFNEPNRRNMHQYIRSVFRRIRDQRREDLDNWYAHPFQMGFSGQWRHRAGGMSNESIDQIRTELFTEGITKYVECAVCLDVFKEKESVKILQCGHPYHTECIVKWLRAKPRCPMCRKWIIN